MKKAAGREKDKEDLRVLERYIYSDCAHVGPPVFT
jgi:hypothetical protein